MAGIAVAMLSVTGVVTWLRKRRARLQAVSAPSYPVSARAPMAAGR